MTDWSPLDYTKPDDESTRESRVLYRLCPEKTRPRDAATVIREEQLLFEYCGRDADYAYHLATNVFGVIQMRDDMTAITARFTAAIQSILFAHAPSFADTFVERAAIMSLCRYIVAQGLSFQDTNLYADAARVLDDFDKALGDLISAYKREPAFADVDPATALFRAPKMSIEGYARTAREATNLEDYIAARRFIKPFLSTSMEEAQGLYEWLSSFFRSTDNTLKAREEQCGRLGTKTLLGHIFRTSTTQPLLQPYPNIADFMASCIILTSKLTDRGMHVGIALYKVVKYDNISMLNELKSYIAEKFNTYIRETGRPEMDLDQLLDTEIYSHMRAQALFASDTPGVPVQFGRTMAFLSQEFSNILREISNIERKCHSWEVGGAPRVIPSLSLVQEEAGPAPRVIPSLSHEEAGGVISSPDEDIQAPPDGYTPFPVDRQVGYTDHNGSWHSGFVHAIVHRGGVVIGYTIFDPASQKNVEVPWGSVSADYKGKGTARSKGGPLRAVPDGAASSSGAASSGAGSSGAGSSSGAASSGAGSSSGTKSSGSKSSSAKSSKSSGAKSSETGSSSAGAAFKVGDRVKVGKLTGIITGEGVRCFYVLTQEGYVRGGNSIEPKYNNFPVSETKSIASIIVNGTKVEWKNKKGTVEGSCSCFEIEIVSKSGEPYHIYRTHHNMAKA